MKLVHVTLVVVSSVAAGCAAPRPPVVGSTASDASLDAVAAVAAPPRSDVESMIESIPTGWSATGRWRGAGADDAPEVKVTAPRESDSPLREERLVGSNEQPEWTTERRWAKTRSYVIAPGQIEVEQWYKLQMPRGSAPNHLFQTEIGFGFEGGWQLDLYENYGKEPDGPLQHQGVQIEGRYALAKWGEIPLNPTLYLEYVLNYDSTDKIEAKVLFADDLCPGWHWASNLVYEQETSGARETELALSGAISYTILDSKFSVGAEFNLERVTGHGFQSNDDAINEFLIGPSFQWRPTDNSHVDIAPLFGLTKSDRADPRYEIWIVLGWDFGPEQPGHSGPTSSRSR